MKLNTASTALLNSIHAGVKVVKKSDGAFYRLDKKVRVIKPVQDLLVAGKVVVLNNRLRLV